MLCSAQELGTVGRRTRACSRCRADAPVGADVRDVARARRHAAHAQAHAQSRRLPVDARHRARGRRADRRAARAARDERPFRRANDATFAVRIADPLACPRFAARVIADIERRGADAGMDEAPPRARGIRSISAVVDVTNYVMLELGQPLHAYDLDLLDGAIVVRFAAPARRSRCSTGRCSSSTPTCSRRRREKPLGLAGIMGGEHRRISDTRHVFLEGAFWNPAAIQGRARRSASRATPAPLRARRRLRQRRAGGRARDRAHPRDLRRRARTDRRIRWRRSPRASPCACASRARELLGVAVPADEIADIFSAARPRGRPLGARRRRDFRRHAAVVPLRPRDRGGLRRGGRAPARLRRDPGAPAARPGRHAAATRGAALVARSARASSPRADWQEVITFSFVARRGSALSPATRRPIRLLNPIASHLDVMRTTLVGASWRTSATTSTASTPACASSRSAGCSPAIRP